MLARQVAVLSRAIDSGASSAIAVLARRITGGLPIGTA